jgi:hypothetical protein
VFLDHEHAQLGVLQGAHEGLGCTASADHGDIESLLSVL